MDQDGASPNERLLRAARSGDEDNLLDAIEDEADINCKDGAGNTPLHLAVRSDQVHEVLEHILAHDKCDVDPVNSITGETPLHYAIQLEDKETRRAVVESLLDAGADTSIKDKRGNTVLDILPEADTEIRPLIRKAQARDTISADDIAEDDELGSDSGSD